jgi:regulatory LuxR family protein
VSRVAGELLLGDPGAGFWHVGKDRAKPVDVKLPLIRITRCSGLSNTEITQRLYLSMGTVKTHIGRLLTKLNARDRAQLVIAAYDAGLARRR